MSIGYRRTRILQEITFNCLTWSHQMLQLLVVYNTERNGFTTLSRIRQNPKTIGKCVRCTPTICAFPTEPNDLLYCTHGYIKHVYEHRTVEKCRRRARHNKRQRRRRRRPCSRNTENTLARAFALNRHGEIMALSVCSVCPALLPGRGLIFCFSNLSVLCVR